MNTKIEDIKKLLRKATYSAHKQRLSVKQGKQVQVDPEFWVQVQQDCRNRLKQLGVYYKKTI